MMVENASKLIMVARSYVGLQEDPRGSNDGQQLRHVLRGTAFQPGQPWCYFFALACALEAFGSFSKLPTAIKYTGSCQEAADHARSLGKLSRDAAVGAIFLLHDGNLHYHHAGIVTGLPHADGSRPTIEGNSNDTGSIEGYEVVVHRRSGMNLAYIVW